MWHWLFVLTACLAGVWSPWAWAANEADGRVFGFALGETMPALPHCDMLNSYLADERQKVTCNLLSWSVVSPLPKPWGADQYTLYLDTASRPPYLFHDEEFGDVHVYTLDGKVESLSFSTVGEKALAQAFGALSARYGKPTRYEKSRLIGKSGQGQTGLSALWVLPTYSIRLNGIPREGEWGRVEFLTPKYQLQFEKWQINDNPQWGAQK